MNNTYNSINITKTLTVFWWPERCHSWRWRCTINKLMRCWRYQHHVELRNVDALLIMRMTNMMLMLLFLSGVLPMLVFYEHCSYCSCFSLFMFICMLILKRMIWALMAGLAVHLKKRFFVKASSWYSKHKNDGVYWVPRLFVFVLSFFYTMEMKAYSDQLISPKAHFI